MEPVEALRALSNVKRKKIVELLLTYNCCVRALARNLDVTEATISQHLQVLRKAGIVEGVKDGYFVHYRINRNTLKELSLYLQDLSEIQTQPCTLNIGKCNPAVEKICSAHQ